MRILEKKTHTHTLADLWWVECRARTFIIYWRVELWRIENIPSHRLFVLCSQANHDSIMIPWKTIQVKSVTVSRNSHWTCKYDIIIHEVVLTQAIVKFENAFIYSYVEISEIMTVTEHLFHAKSTTCTIIYFITRIYEHSSETPRVWCITWVWLAHRIYVNMECAKLLHATTE